jgi:hypothetical protein
MIDEEDRNKIAIDINSVANKMASEIYLERVRQIELLIKMGAYKHKPK